MTLDQALRISSIILAVTGITGLVLAGEVPLGLLLIAYGSAALSAARAFGWGSSWRIFHLSRATWNTLVVAALLAFVAEFFWTAPGLLQPSIHFLIVLMINKLLTLHHRKDFPQLYALSLLALLAAAALTVELWYASVAAAFVLAAVWSLMLYHLVCERDDMRGERDGGASRSDPAPAPITAGLFWTTNGIAVGGLCLTVLIFFVTPRVGTGLFQKQRLDLIRTTGFSDRVDLGVIGAVKLDQTVVMRVELPEVVGPPPERLYFRGVAYDLYNGTSWANSFPHRYSISRNTEGIFKVDTQGKSNRGSESLRQDVLIEALDTPALFGVSFVHSLEGNFLIVQTDGMGGLYLPTPPATRLQYTVYSNTVPMLPEERTAPSYEYPEEIRRHNLQLPPGVERVQALAEDVTRQATSVFERATMIQRHLRTTYRYSLDVGATIPSNPVDEFLFVRKTGYCEHYATAMVLMLRTLGIPARLVTGFLHGEWNDFGNYYTVRQRDAHAWVEVYFPGSGWRTFDPTPAAGVGTVMPAWSQAVRWMDSVRLKWDRVVIRYSLRDQALVVRGIRERGEQVRDNLAGTFVAVRRWINQAPSRITALVRSDRPLAVGMLLAWLGLMAVMFTLVRRWRKVRLRRTPGLHREQHVAAMRLYGRMLTLLEARGLRKSPGVTPFEFAREVSSRSTLLGEPVQRLTALYCRIRFGHDELSADDQARAEDLMKSLSTVR